MKKLLRFIRQALFILLALLFLYNLWVFGHVIYWRYNNPTHTAFMVDYLNNRHERHMPATLKQHWVPYDNISIHLKRAVISAEDGQFMMHSGFDWQGIETAMHKNIRKGKVVAGGSTISQQLAKNLFLSGHKTLWRKTEEAVITVMLENVMTKRRILEIYLNTIEWGNGIFGAQAASQHYFGVNAGQLSSSQAARLAAMISNPRFYDNNRYTKKLSKKARRVIQHMKK